MEANTFLEWVFKDDQKNAKIKEDEDNIDIVNYLTLNKKQKLIFKRVELYYYNILVSV